MLNGQLKAELINYYEKLLVSDVLEMKKVLNNVTTVTKLINDFYFNNNLLINFDYNITQVKIFENKKKKMKIKLF